MHWTSSERQSGTLHVCIGILRRAKSYTTYNNTNNDATLTKNSVGDTPFCRLPRATPIKEAPIPEAYQTPKLWTPYPRSQALTSLFEAHPETRLERGNPKRVPRAVQPLNAVPEEFTLRRHFHIFLHAVTCPQRDPQAIQIHLPGMAKQCPRRKSQGGEPESFIQIHTDAHRFLQPLTANTIINLNPYEPMIHTQIA